jgi:hypothetical protein
LHQKATPISNKNAVIGLLLSASIAVNCYYLFSGSATSKQMVLTEVDFADYIGVISQNSYL